MFRLHQEPLIHFVLIGAVIFAVDAWRHEPEQTADRIVVDAATITRLKEGWSRQFGRSPDAADLRDLIQAHLREEVFCREALAMGLDGGDTIVRRRLAQKMEFLTQDIAIAAVPDEATLSAYFEANAGRYRKPGRIDFRHVYFSRDKRGPTAETDAAAALPDLSRPGVSAEAFGDPFLGGDAFAGASPQDLDAMFGGEFPVALHEAPVGRWFGPVPSSYGLHLVHVTGKEEAPPASLASVKEEVLRDYQSEQRQAANQEVYEGLLERYEVILDESALKAAAPEPATTAQAGS